MSSINDLPRDRFLELFAGIYEHSPWVAETVFDGDLVRPAEKPSDLATAMAGVVASAGRDRRLALLLAHPDLAGRLAKAGQLSPESATEQAGAGLDQCSPEEFEEFTRLNALYRERFGFPFIIAVRGRSRQDILAAFRRRLRNTPDAEFDEACRQVDRIAELRLLALDELFRHES